jgi:peptidoglycan/LPS O-acetylase OafA/YrhL
MVSIFFVISGHVLSQKALGESADVSIRGAGTNLTHITFV